MIQRPTAKTAQTAKTALITLIACLAFAACNNRNDGKRVAEGVTAPRLANRQEILAQRTEIANRLLAPGDSILIPVYIYVDPQGLPHQPEIKQDVLDPRVGEAVIALVRNMRFTPAMKDGQPTTVMLTVPVKLVRR